MKTIKRTIYVSRIEDFETENVGVHFTSDLGYNHKGGGSNGLTKTAEYKVTVIVSEYVINEEATTISNNNYPTEKEVVLEMNQALNASVQIQKAVDGGFGRVVESKAVINTGTRADLWVKNL